MTTATDLFIPEPMNARNEDARRKLELLEPADWWMEKKLDGFRLLVVSDFEAPDHPLEGFSRAGRGQLLHDRLPHIWDELDVLSPMKYTVLDGELSTEDDDFSHVAGVMKSKPDRAVRLQEETRKPLIFVLFDVLFWNGRDVRDWPQHKRRELLERELKRGDAKYLRLSATFPLDRELVLAWQAVGSEGAILKNRNAPYVSGKRPTDTWLKIKAVEDADVVVMGFTEANEGKTGKFKGLIGAVQFGQYRDGELLKRGQTSGMDDATRRDMTLHPEKYLGRVMVIKHMGKQRDGFRHPQFKHMREDKLPEECTWD